MLRSHDVVPLIVLLTHEDRWTMRDMAKRLHWPHASVQRSLSRLSEAGLYDKRRKRVPAAQAEEFLIHAVKYIAPARRGGETRGIPTAWAASPLVERLAPPDELPPVWAHPHGHVRGVELEALHPRVPNLAAEDPRSYEILALVDAVRAGDARVRELADGMLVDRLRARTG